MKRIWIPHKTVQGLGFKHGFIRKGSPGNRSFQGHWKGYCHKTEPNQAAVGINYSSNTEAAEEVVSVIEKDGDGAIALPGDVSDASTVAELMAQINVIGDIGYSVNNAGITRTAF